MSRQQVYRALPAAHLQRLQAYEQLLLKETLLSWSALSSALDTTSTLNPSETEIALQMLQELFDSRVWVPGEVAGHLTQHCFKVLYSPHLPVPHVQKLATLLATALRRFRKIPVTATPPEGTAQEWMPYLSWQNLLSLLRRYFLDHPGTFYPCEKSHREHVKAPLLKLAKKAVRFFPPSAAAEIEAHFYANGPSPTDRTWYEILGFFTLLVPFHTPSQVSPWLNRWLELTSFAPQARTTVALRLDLCARIMKHCRQHESTEEEKKSIETIENVINTHLPYLVQSTFHLLPFRIKGSSGPSSLAPLPNEIWKICRAKSAIGSLAKLLAYCFNGDLKNPALKLLEHTLHAISSYFHPSNEGPWTSSLTHFVHDLASYYHKRYKGPSSNLEQDAQFVQILLKVVIPLMYGKQSTLVIYTCHAIRELSYIAPNPILPVLLEQSLPNLAPHAPAHRTFAALSFFNNTSHVLFHRRLFPEGVRALRQIMWETLDAFDPVNLMKSKQVLTFYQNLTSTIPLVPCDPSAMDTDETDEFVQEARSATYHFEEWLFAFFEKLVRFLQHQDASGEKKMGTEQQSTRARLYCTIRNICCSLPDEVYTKIVSKFCRILLETSSLSQVRQYVGSVLTAMCLGKGQLALEGLVYPLFDRLGTSEASSEKEWYLYAISRCLVRLGKGLSQAKESITSLLQIYLTEESRKLRKMARKVIRRYLNGLLDTYPIDYCPFDSTTPVEEYPKEWGRFLDVDKSIEELEMTWYAPGAEEMAAAQSIVTQLGQHCDEMFSEKTTWEQFHRYLLWIRCTIRGAASVLGPFAEEEESIESENLQFQHKYHSSTDYSILDQPTYLQVKDVPLREYLQKYIKYVLIRFQRDTTVRQAETRCLLLLTCLKLCTFNATSSGHFAREAPRNSLLRRFQLVYSCGQTSKLVQRSLLVDQAYMNYLRRFAVHPKLLSVPKSLILEVLEPHMIDADLKVRQTAHKVAGKVLDQFPTLRRPVLLQLFDKLRQRKIEKAHVLGACDFLRSKCTWVITHSELSSRLIIALCDASHHPEDVVQTAIHQVFSAYTTKWLRNGIWTHELVQETINELSTIFSSAPNLHWRSELMIARFFAYLLGIAWYLGPNTSYGYSSVILEYFFHQALFETKFLPLQQIALRTLTTVLNVSQKNEQEIEGQHRNDQGWSLGRDQVYSSTQLSRQSSYVFVESSNETKVQIEDDIKQRLGAVFEQQLSQFLEILVEDHPTLSAHQRAIATGQPVPTHTKGTSPNPSKLGQGAASSIVQSVEEPDTTGWPVTLYGVTSKCIELTHCILIQCLIDTHPVLVQGFLHYLEDAWSTEREIQITCLEVWCGIVLSTVGKQNQAIQTRCETIFEKILTTCTSEVLEEVTFLLRYIWTYRSTDELEKWLGKQWLKFVNVVPNDSEPPALSAKRLRFIPPVLCETGWRSASLVESIGHCTTQITSNPYHLVRQHTGIVLSFCLRNLARVEYHSSTHVMPTNSTSPEFLQTLLHQMTQAHQTHSKQDLAVIDSAICLILGLRTAGDVWYSQHIIGELLPLVCHAAHSSDSDLSSFAKKCAQFLAWTPLLNGEWIQTWIQALVPLLQDPTEKFAVRTTALRLAYVMVIRHFVCVPKDVVVSFVDLLGDLLVDPEVEVRMKAMEALCGVVACCAPRHLSIKKLVKGFFRQVKATKSGEKSQRIERHGGVLGLSALVQSAPYDVPKDWMPSVLAFLAGIAHEPAPIGPGIQKLLGSFKKTHADEWHVFETRFTPEELSALNEASIAPSYFA